MSPIPKENLIARFVLLDATVQIQDAAVALIRQAGSDWANWYLVLRFGPGGFNVVTLFELGEIIRQYGERVLHARCSDIPALKTICRSVNIDSMGLGAAEREMYRSPKSRLVVLENGEPVGLLVNPSRDVVQLPDQISRIFLNMAETTKGMPPISGSFEAATPGPPPPAARFLNVCLTNLEHGQVIRRDTDLAIDTRYLLRVDIGALSQESVILHPTQFPEDKLPASENGWWLEAIAVSDDFQLAPERFHFFLPRRGSSWVCHCQPGQAHHCTRYQRQAFLFLPLRTPVEGGRKTLRLTIYHRKNAVQSVLLTAQVSRAEQMGAGYEAEIDFSLTAQLNDLDFLPERRANILINQNMNGTHRLIYNGQTGRPNYFSFGDNYMKKITDELRAQLDRIHYSPSGLLGRSNNFDNNNAKSKEGFIADLTKLAETGWGLYDAISNKIDLAVEEPGIIQISRAATEFVFPWAFVYDLPKEAFAPWEPCELIMQWDGKGPLVPAGARRCPHEDKHGLNTLCPFGFWGYRHIIELPPGIYQVSTDQIKQTIHRQANLDFILIQNTTLDPSLAQEHVGSLQKKIGIILKPVVSRGDAKNALDAPTLEIVYFYVHGKRLKENLQAPTSLLVGNDEEILPGDIKAWYQAYWKKNPIHWRTSAPLIFINGCHTTDLIPDSPVSFVDEFCRAAAAGVIGTEITISQRVASEMAESFFEYFVNKNISGMYNPVGETLRLARLNLLNKGNLLGLVYTAYCVAELALSD